MPDYELTAMEREIAELVVDALQLEMEPVEIDPKAPLFGDGLGLDSIDALELGVSISKKYQLQIKAEDEQTREIFSSLGALASYVETNAAN